MSVDRRTMRTLIDRALTVRVATVSANGTPMVTPLWFARDGDVIVAGTRRAAPLARHIDANPAVVLLFGDRGGRPAAQVLRVAGTARIRDSSALTLARKLRMARRYFVGPGAIAHWATNWRKLGVRGRYYAERTETCTIEIALGDGEFVDVPRAER
jgi:general stress protein 26